MSAPRQPGAAPEAAKAKAIVLFSDGTGNSSAKVFKTNVWRMYESVDLGPAAEGMRPQISYYDDGVGTSSFKPLAALGGAFGWGLKRNVLDIYRYACRNFRPDDDIYIFGFSRGAFTARLVAALITAEGLVTSDSESDLRHKTLRAYRHFRGPLLPRRLQWPTRLARRIRDGLAAVADRIRDRPPYDATANQRPPIRFIGVWDTVGAYGGPIVEVTRGVDNWFFRLSMPDYKLDERVQCARQALAIDDERDAFHPLLWDEVHEQALAEAGRVSADRLQQVWFSGMHADVGGGYPDESLSYVSLLWMMEEAERAGLRTLAVIKNRILALASSYGPLHDSRSGIGAYYRYQPRKIAAWLHPVDDRLRSLHDPAITGADERPQGLLRSVRVHESVINRIATGTDRYAPITLADAFEIVPPEEVGETTPQPTSETTPPTGAARPLIDRDLRARLRDGQGAARRRAGIESVWDLVWWRRLVYFATLAATLLLVAMPLFASRLDDPLTDSRTSIGGVLQLLSLVLPSFTSTWIEVYASHPSYFLLLLLTVVGLLGLGTALEHTLRDRARAFWRAELTGGVPAARDTWVRRFRNSHAYQRGLQVIKWSVLPDFVIAPLLAVAIGYLLLGGYTQAWLAVAESGNRLCAPPVVAPPPIVRASGALATKDLCSESFGTVSKGTRYLVTLDLEGKQAWADARVPASPLGVPASQFPYAVGYLGVPLRRVIDAHYLQPLVEIRERSGGRPGSHAGIYALEMRQVEGSQTLFRGEFEAAGTGDLFVFVNDAVLPFWTGPRGFDHRYFYERSGSEGKRGNYGTATVTVEAFSTPSS